MSTFFWQDAFVAFNSTTITGATKSVTLDFSVKTVDDTVMGQNTMSNFPSLKDWKASIVFAQDFNAGQIDSQMNGLLGTRFYVELRPTTAAASTQNPRYTGYALMTDYAIINGKVGDFAEATVSLVPAKSSTGGITTNDLVRLTS